MKKLYIVKTKEEFNNLINKGYYSKDNNLKYDRFGISVGKKIGKAVTRNKYKRKIRSIIDIYRKDYLKRKDYIIILRSRALNLNYKDLKTELFSLLLNKGDLNEK